MNKEQMNKLARNMWGFFVVAVWIVGVPMVLKISYRGMESAISEARAVVTGTRSIPAKGEQIEILEAYDKSEFDEMVSVYNEYKALKKSKKGK
jgi:hypothetical protein